MLLRDAAARIERQQRRARIADIGAGQHGGDYAKKLLQLLAD